jgi:hypothetical protein
MSLGEIVGTLPTVVLPEAVPSSANIIQDFGSRSLLFYRLAKWIWRRLPVRLRNIVINAVERALRWKNSTQHRNSTLMLVVRRAWHLFPSFVRTRLAAIHRTQLDGQKD